MTTASQPGATKKRRPVQQFREGRFLVSVWEDDTVSFSRLYKEADDGPWLHSRTFYEKDLQLLQEPVLKAQEWFEKMELERGRKAADAAQKELTAEFSLPAQVL